MPVLIDGDLTIRHATRRRAQLLDWLAAANPGDALDVAQVAACDSSGLQLLLALRLSLAGQGRSLALCNVTPPLAELLQRCGLEDALPHA